MGGSVVTGPGGEEVEQAAGAMAAALGPHTGRDWTVRAGSLEWNCWATAGHVAHDLVAYAGQLSSGARGRYLPFDLVVRPEASPGDVMDVVAAAAGLLRDALRSADPAVRGWHWGPTDPSGFAALGVNEILVHTVDIAAGLGVDWRPPGPLCGVVLRRLFPDAPAGDPVRTLLWATGRGDLPGRSRVTSWIPHAAIG
jgi:uncharacterized protein (TIGR03083 family)